MSRPGTFGRLVTSLPALNLIPTKPRSTKTMPNLCGAIVPWRPSLEVVVSSEDDAEVRRVSITNLGARARNIQVTSYAEISLTSQAADVAHPAFSNLFVETEFAPDVGAILATRRKRSEDEPSVWAAHVLFAEGETVGDLQFETDRARFLGRGHDLRNPISIVDGRPLSNTVGSVLDPVMSLRRTVHIPPGTTAHVMFTTIAASTRQQALDLADKYRDARAFERTLTLAWTQAQVQLHHLGIGSEEAHLFQRLANAVIYSDVIAAAHLRCAQPDQSGHFHAMGAGNFRRSADRSGAHRQ